VYGWLLVMLAQQHGFPVAEGGAQRLTDALIARLVGRGGEVRCRSAVRRIVTRGGRAVGVVTEAGEAWRAGRAVVADVPAPLLYRDLVGLDCLPASLAADLEYFTWDNATVKLDWALSGPVPWREPAVARAGTVHLGVDLDGMSQYTTDLACGRIPGQPFVLCGQMTTADPSRSPPGTEVVWAYSHLPRRRSWSAGEIDEQAARIQQTIEDQAPGFASRVIARTVTGPDRLFAENPSLPGGSIVGGTMAAYQQLVLRPTPGLGRADTPFDRLYLASASNHPGGAVHGAAGANAARAALARDRPVLGTVYGAGMKAAHRAIHSGRKQEDRPWPSPVSS
jgi:phytoene dehydrogenase-like protein